MAYDKRLYRYADEAQDNEDIVKSKPTQAAQASSGNAVNEDVNSIDDIRKPYTGNQNGVGSGYMEGGAAANPNQQYINQLDSIYNQIMGRGPFAYDLQGDMLYRQYADQYTQLGKQAMRDTQAQAAALTGGYGNSWAESAGSQAYQGYLSQLNAMVPEFYDRAYNAWLNEGDQLMQQYDMAATHPGVIAALTPQATSGRSGGRGKTGDDDGGSGDYADFLAKVLAAAGNAVTGNTNVPVEYTNFPTGPISGATSYEEAMALLNKDKKK